jgi:diketogulonate reductase-like aldo/keto reductase
MIASVRGPDIFRFRSGGAVAPARAKLAPMTRSVSFPDHCQVPALGQGTWRMGENVRQRQQEIAAVRAGVELGMTLIDTAEMYGDGAAETLLGKALAGLRDQVFLVSKVYPQNAGRGRIERACEASLRRLKTDRLDLYLLHWRGSVPLAETVEGMEALVAAGKIRRWGVSNLDHGDMDELFRAGGERCATNQILYNVTERGAEFDLLSKLSQRHIPTMAYSPVGQGRLPNSPALSAVAKRHGATPFQVALAWVLRDPMVIAIPKAADAVHVNDNRHALDLVLTAEDLAAIDADFPPPTRKTRLAML